MDEKTKREGDKPKTRRGDWGFCVLLITGVVLVAFGCLLITPALGMIVGGAECLGLAWVVLMGGGEDGEGA